MVQTVHPRYEHGNVNTAAGPAGLELACLNQAGAPPALAGHTIVVAGSGGAAEVRRQRELAEMCGC